MSHSCCFTCTILNTKITDWQQLTIDKNVDNELPYDGPLEGEIHWIDDISDFTTESSPFSNDSIGITGSTVSLPDDREFLSDDIRNQIRAMENLPTDSLLSQQELYVVDDRLYVI